MEEEVNHFYYKLELANNFHRQKMFPDVAKMTF